MAWQWLLGIVSSILFIWGILPYVTGRIRNVGVWVTCAVGAVGVILAVCGNAVARVAQAVWASGKAAQAIVCAVCALLLLLILLFIGVSLLLVTHACCKTTAQKVTVLIPGAKLYEDHPSRMLLQRLQTAAAYLKAHPSLPCVVSGGQGADEPCAEASMMRTYLLEMGIDAHRIYTEAISVNTFENMQYSYKVIKKNNLPADVVIVTQEFHQYRCGKYAKRAGLTPVGALTCKTPLHLWLCYWVREFAGVCRMWLLGY